MATTARIGVIGLGVIGLPLASNLVTAGASVQGYVRRPEMAEKLQAAGIRVSDSIAELARSSDVVITVLPDSPDVEDVVFGEDGLLQSMSSGSLHIDHSTIAPETSRRVAEALAAAGVESLDAPVSGGEIGAIQATLSIMVGGSEAAYERALPILRSVGRSIQHIGASGAGQLVKAANQLIVAGNIALVAEAVEFLKAHGIELAPAMELLQGGLAGSRVLETKSPLMLSGEYPPGFRAELHRKDLRIGMEAARQAGVVTPVAAAAALLVESLCATGHGGEDHSALIRVIQSLSTPAS